VYRNSVRCCDFGNQPEWTQSPELGGSIVQLGSNQDSWYVFFAANLSFITPVADETRLQVVNSGDW
jgi:hypothetical protein